MDARTLLTQLVYVLPTLLVLLVVAALVLTRRDEGSWWRLGLGGVAVLALDALAQLAAPTVFLSADGRTEVYQLYSFLQLLLHLVGIGLLGAAAVVGRRARQAHPDGPAPTYGTYPR